MYLFYANLLENNLETLTHANYLVYHLDSRLRIDVYKKILEQPRNCIEEFMSPARDTQMIQYNYVFDPAYI